MVLAVRGAIATRQWVEKVEATAEAIRAEAAEATKLVRAVARAGVCECYEDTEGLVLCANCSADMENHHDDVHVLAEKKQWYAQKGAVVKIQCGAT